MGVKKRAASAQLQEKPQASSGHDPEASKQLALQVADAALDKKALDIEIIEVGDKVDYADFVVVMTGRSDRQVNAIAKGVQEDLKVKHGAPCLGVEGLPQSSWVLLDFGDVVVHVFHQDTRGYYNLEGLWLDAKRVEFDSPSSDDGFSLS